MADKKEKKYVSNNAQLMAEWDYEKNQLLNLTPNIPIFSHKEVFWKCKNGHSWPAIIAARTRGNGCPFCSGREVIEGVNDLQTVMPHLVEEWDYERNPLLPSQVTKSSGKEVFWKCAICGHKWQDSVNHRYNGRNCPQCYKEMHTSFPEQAILFYIQKKTTAINQYKVDKKYEIDIFLPLLNVGIEYDGMAYHNTPEAEERVKKKNDYLYKKGIRLIRVKEVTNSNFFVAKDIIYYTPDTNYYKLSDVINALHQMIFNDNYNNTFDIYSDRVLILENYILLRKSQSLAFNHPEIAKEWHPTANGKLSPETFLCGSPQKVFWLCNLGHTYPASISHRVSGTGCPFCAGKKVLKGFNDFETHFPELSKEWHPNNTLLPSQVTMQSHTKVMWICTNGHEYPADPHHRAQGTGCPVCTGKKIIPGENDLATVRPELTKEWHPYKNLPLTPSNISKSSGKKVWWLCSKCGHEWPAHVNKRAAERGCPNCYAMSRKSTNH